MPELLKVLLLDDEPIVGKRLEPALAKIGCKGEVFEDPRKALERIDQMDFDIVITDVRMGEIDGIEVLEHVRQNSPFTRVIMITGYAMISWPKKLWKRVPLTLSPSPLSRMI